MENNYVILIYNGFGWQLYSENESSTFENAGRIARNWCNQSKNYKAKVLQVVAKYEN